MSGPSLDAADDLSAHRTMLFGLAYRLTGSAHDAEDVLQDAYLRMRQVDRAVVLEPQRYLTRVVTRLALDVLRARQARRETYVGPWLPEPLPTGHAPAPVGLPEEIAVRDDTLSIAVLHLMERLSAPERAVYVLRTAFGLPYAEIAEVLDREPAHCRQLHHRAAAALAADRRRYPADRREHARLLDAFVAAARDADLDTLRRLLRADVSAWSDGGGRVNSARREIRGADKVARFFAAIYSRDRGALDARPVAINGGAGVIVSRPRGAHALTLAVTDGSVSGIYLISNPVKLTRLMTPLRGTRQDAGTA
ncbi:RNA polymerase sigma-70 factor [Luedemannella helvata]|uniref:RNA polymerase sigma-70 factor n=1 Tax=Luedemannella helvata TaxID=349315 RepID=A0ABP4X9X0_9ACTN